MFRPEFINKRIIRTRNINQAAFCTTFGANLLAVEGDYPNNTFVVSVSPFVLWYEKYFGWLPYRKYSNQRVRLKDRGRSQAGLPKRYCGRIEGFTFADLAHC
jgi:hypothetical protein